MIAAAVVLSSPGWVNAQQADPKPARQKFVEEWFYPAKTYDDDREMTGPYFRKLRRIRAAEGNAAAAARLTSAWEAYNQLRIDLKWAPGKGFDTWGFWVWHEAQFDTGKEDPEWRLMLYKWIHDYSKATKKFDWVAHVRPNVIVAYANLCHWGHVRALSNEAEDYFSGIGFDLDPGKLPSKGQWDPMVPYVETKEFPVFVPNSRHVVYWQRNEEKNPDKQTYIDNILSSLINQLADEDYLMGRWDRAVERSLWVREWSNAINRHNKGKDKKSSIKRFNEDRYHKATYQIANIMIRLGFKEKALMLVEEGISRKGGTTEKHLLDHSQLEIIKERLVMESGKADAALLARLDKVIAREKKLPAFDLGSFDTARYLKADCLVAMGRMNEAEALLQGICKRLDRKLGGWMTAELHLVDLMLARREFQTAEKTLRELMEAVRVNGVKMDELDLYRMYVKWAMLAGKWDEALRAQREVMRLLEAFRMTPILPLELATLSRIMAELGNHAESDRLAALAKKGSVGREKLFIQSVEDELAKRPAAGISDSSSRVKLQPSKVLSLALDNFPSRAVVSLVNHGTREAKGALKVSGLPAKIRWDQELGTGTVEVTDARGNSAEQLGAEIRIAAGAVAVFFCSGKLASEMNQTVFLEWVGEGQGAERCEWTIEVADKESDGAVIDAAEYTDDPFFLIPVYHHLQSRSKGPVNLRVVASRPCRVEMYDEEGVLQMVDAEGNGSLENSGDWLGLDRDRNLAAEVVPDEVTGETRFLFHLDPKEWNSEEPLRIRVEWLVDGTWFLAAEDQIVFGK